MPTVYVEHLISELLAAHGGKLVSVVEPEIRALVQAALTQERERINRLVAACLMAREELVFGGDWETARAVLTAAAEG